MNRKKYFAQQLNIKTGLNAVKIKDGQFKFIRDFAILSLSDGEDISLETSGRETGIVILRGQCDISIDGHTHNGLGGRDNVFDGKPTGIYIPIDKKYTISSHDVEIAICAAKCNKASDFAIIYPEGIRTSTAGKDNWEREVRIVIGPDSPSVNLIVGETLNPPGNWSGTPPARHEKNNLPEESLHEELYYFKVDKPQGWGIERLYSDERGINELVYLQDNTVTFMPWGYHQIVAAAGYTLYYLFFLAGEGKRLAQFEDPEHKWIKNA